MKKAYSKSVIAIVFMFIVSAIGFGTAFGYGGGSSSGGRGYINRTYPNLPSQASDTARAATQKGRVLGASTVVFSKYLRRGESSDTVRDLQERLRADGYFTYPTSTGYFGPITFEAVRIFQLEHGIPATGFVGRLTVAALNGNSANTAAVVNAIAR